VGCLLDGNIMKHRKALKVFIVIVIISVLLTATVSADCSANPGYDCSYYASGEQCLNVYGINYPDWHVWGDTTCYTQENHYITYNTCTECHESAAVALHIHEIVHYDCAQGTKHECKYN